MNDFGAAIADVRRRLAEADHVLVAAGAGLSVAAGIDYADHESFARLFPALVRRGFHARYELIGYPGLPAPAHWGYWATHVSDIRFADRRHRVYEGLFELLAAKDHFVLTSNVDAMFVRNGFEPARVWTPQGDYAQMQCLGPCRRVTWPSQPPIARAMAAIDPTSQEVTDPAAIPSCPNCGGPVFLNVNAGGWFVDDPYAAEHDRFEAWLHQATAGRLLLLEFGAGMNTPGVVRWRSEAIVAWHPNAWLVRVNRTQTGLRLPIADRCTLLAMGAEEVIDALRDSSLAA